MKKVAYCHPFVPPEWIAAHGLRPRWLPCGAGEAPAVSVRRGVCPVAAALLDAFAAEPPADALVLLTVQSTVSGVAPAGTHSPKVKLVMWPLDVGTNESLT